MATTLQNVIDKLKLSVVAGADILAGKPITVDATGKTGTVAAADGHIIGVSMNEVLSGQDLAVLAQGQCDVIAGGAISALDYVKVGANGKFLSANAADLAAGKVVGMAVGQAVNDGDTVTILVHIY